MKTDQLPVSVSRQPPLVVWSPPGRSRHCRPPPVDFQWSSSVVRPSPADPRDQRSRWSVKHRSTRPTASKPRPDPACSDRHQCRLPSRRTLPPAPTSSAESVSRGGGTFWKVVRLTMLAVYTATLRIVPFCAPPPVHCYAKQYGIGSSVVKCIGHY